MPAIIPVLITAGATFLQQFFTGASVGAALGAAGIVAGSSIALQLLANRRQSVDSQGSIVRASEYPARWVLGRARVGGMLAFYLEGNREKDYGPMTVDMALIVSEGPLEAIERVWVDGVEAKIRSRTADRDGVHLNFESKFAGHIAIWEYFAADGTGGASLRAVSGTWTNNHRLNGKSWVHVRLIQNAYDKGDLEDRYWKHFPEINFQVKGLKFTWPGQTEPRWTDSAAAIRYWWLTERCGISPDQIDLPSFLAAHSLCSERVQTVLPRSYRTEGYQSSSARYAINGVVSSDDGPDEINTEFDFCWQGNVVEANARLYFRPGADRPIQGVITDRDILEVPTVQIAPVLQERVNAVSMKISQSNAKDYNSQDIPIQHAKDNAGNLYRLIRDAGQELWTDLGTRRFINDPIAAGRLLVVALRRMQALSGFVYRIGPGKSLEWFGLIPGDWVRIQDPHLLVDRTLLITNRAVNEDWSITLSLKDQPEGVYKDTLVLPPDPSPGLGSPDDPRLPYPLPDPENPIPPPPGGTGRIPDRIVSPVRNPTVRSARHYPVSLGGEAAFLIWKTDWHIPDSAAIIEIDSSTSLTDLLTWTFMGICRPRNAGALGSGFGLVRLWDLTDDKKIGPVVRVHTEMQDRYEVPRIAPPVGHRVTYQTRAVNVRGFSVWNQVLDLEGS